MDDDLPPPSIDEPNQVLLRGPAIDDGSPPLPSSSTPSATPSTTAVVPTAGGSKAAFGADDDIPPPPQRRRTSSFEYHEDGPSQYDSLKLLPRGNGISALFLDLLRGKIREAERQLHFAILSSSTHDRHDASKRCSCALAELDYVRSRVVFPPPIQLLDARVLRQTALSSLRHTKSEDALLDAKKAESLIQRAFQVLGELIDWEEVKRRGAAVEMMEEFLPMCYFGRDGGNKPSDEVPLASSEGDFGTVDFTETMVLWYQMMIDHARITFTKAQIKEGLNGKKIKIENCAKAAKLFAVALEGLEEIYSAEDGTDTEYMDYKLKAGDGLQQIADIAVREWKQDELVELVESSTPKLNMEGIKLKIIKAMQRVQERNQEAAAKRKEHLDDQGYAERPPKTPVNGDDADQETEVTKNKGKGRATDTDDATPLSPKPISAREKGKGKAVILDDDKEKGLPSYTDLQGTKEKEEDWVIVSPKE